tara:strand:- start:450 stop:572 length:123 start_codon:yes stop_codon:yes gene_type:complete
MLEIPELNGHALDKISDSLGIGRALLATQSLSFNFYYDIY